MRYAMGWTHDADDRVTNGCQRCPAPEATHTIPRDIGENGEPVCDECFQEERYLQINAQSLEIEGDFDTLPDYMSQ